MRSSGEQASLRLVVARNIRHYRLQAALSQEQLGGVSNLHRTYISEIERGLRNVSIDNIERIATSLSIPPHRLLMPDTSVGEPL